MMSSTDKALGILPETANTNNAATTNTATTAVHADVGNGDATMVIDKQQQDVTKLHAALQKVNIIAQRSVDEANSKSKLVLPKHIDAQQGSGCNNSGSSSSSSSSHCLLPQYAYDDFMIQKVLGEGGFGQVYQVQMIHQQQQEQQQTYALKTLSETTISQALLSNTSDSKKSARRKKRKQMKNLIVAGIDLAMEAYILSRLNHDNIVKIHGVAKATTSLSSSTTQCGLGAGAGGSYFFIMDLLQEETLKDRINRWKKDRQQYHQLRLDGSNGSIIVPSPASSSSKYEIMERIENVILGVVNAMTYLHSKNIIFRDLKPGNIGFSKDDDTVKLFDFGLARELHQVNYNKMAGSLRFMAPECCYKTTPATNIYVDSLQQEENSKKKITEEKEDETPTQSSPTGTKRTSNSTMDSQFSSPPDLSLYSYDLSADVYSFGILLWEICTLQKAFEEHTHDTDLFKQMVHQLNYRPSCFEIQSKTIRNLIYKCWNPISNNRPTFIEIQTILEKKIYNRKKRQQIRMKTNKMKTKTTTVEGEINNKSSSSLSFRGMGKSMSKLFKRQ